jgi:hypothetical protein
VEAATWLEVDGALARHRSLGAAMPKHLTPPMVAVGLVRQRRRITRARRCQMDDWNSDRKPWMQYVELGILVIVVVVIALGYAASRFALSN